MVEIGDKVWFTRGKYKKCRNKWTVRWFGPGKSQRYVVIIRPMNGRGNVAYIVIDCMFQVRMKEAIEIPKALDTDEEWARLIDDYVVGRRSMTGKNKVDITDIEGLYDGTGRGDSRK